jgi:predicted PurR-regulated permease PerM
MPTREAQPSHERPSLPSTVSFESPPTSERRRERASLRETCFHWCLVLLGLAAALTLLPLWAPLLLATWMANLVWPLHNKLAHRIHGRNRAAAVITVLFVVALLTPLVVLGLSLFAAAMELVTRVQSSTTARDALHTLLTSGAPVPETLDAPTLQLNTQLVFDFIQRHSGGALTAATTLFGAAVSTSVAVLVFVFCFYACLLDGKRAYLWLLDHSPLERWQTTRLASAYVETGRGLLLGVGLTALLQGLVATVGYVLIGVPHALVFGLLTVFAALVPSIGTGLVWTPLSLGLWIAGQPGSAAVVLALGCVIAVADNFVRPMLSRYAQLELPTFVLFVAMLGGIVTFGPWGLLAGPLFLRLAVEALRLGRERRELGDAVSLADQCVDSSIPGSRRGYSEG